MFRKQRLAIFPRLLATYQQAADLCKHIPITFKVLEQVLVQVLYPLHNSNSESAFCPRLPKTCIRNLCFIPICTTRIRNPRFIPICATRIWSPRFIPFAQLASGNKLWRVHRMSQEFHTPKRVKFPWDSLSRGRTGDVKITWHRGSVMGSVMTAEVF